MNMFGDRLRELRLELRMTQENLAKAAGVGVSAQQNYEAGKRIPDALYLSRVATIGLDTHYVITGHRYSVVQEVFEPAPTGLDYGLVKNIMELIRKEPRCQDLDAEALARVFVVMYRNNLSWKSKIGADTLSAVLDVLTVG